MTSDLIAVAFVVAGILGVPASIFVARRKGLAAGFRVAAWSLLLLGLWLVGATRLVARLVSAVGAFVTGLVFSPIVWVGVVLLGVAVALFVLSARLRGRSQRKQVADGTPPREVSRRADKPAVSAAGARASDDDFGEIEDILRRRGIT